MLQDNDSRNSRNQKSAKCAEPPIPEKTEHGRQAKTDDDRNPLNISILPADELVPLEIGHVVVRLLIVQLKKQPADVRVKESLRDAIRIIVMIHVFVMPAMFARPHQG